MRHEGIDVCLIPVTDQNKADLVRLAMSQYLGEKCTVCFGEFTTLADLHLAVWRPTETGRLAHKACFDAPVAP